MTTKTRTIRYEGADVTITEIRARYEDEETIQDAVLIHDETDEFHDGDVIYFCAFDEIENAEDLRREYFEHGARSFEIEADGIYRARFC